MSYDNRILIFRQVSPTDRDVLNLIDKLDQYQISLYGIENCNLESPEALEKEKAYMIGVYINNDLIGIGAIKLFETYGEIKRMYLEQDFRGSTIANQILSQLEEYARQNEKVKICLETGHLQYAAIQFYKQHGYKEIEMFGNYRPNSVSVYYEKLLKD